MSSAITVQGAVGGTASVDPGQVVASYPTYEQAQRAVDHLSDSAFPVEHSAIIGRDLRLVEQVVGRITSTRAAMMGAGSGAWWGLFVGALVGLFLPVPEWLAVIVTAVVIGAVAGALFGFAARWAMAGKRDFASTSAVVADRYDVVVNESHAQHAAELLSSLG